MIPILFNAEADPDALLDVNSIPLFDVDDEQLLASGDKTAARLFETNGLGVLTDCTRCEVTEERNGEYELVLDYPSNGVHYDEIALRQIILVKPNASDGPQAFRIYFISAEIDGMKTVNARHLIYDLSGVPVLPFTAQNAAAACAGLINNAAVESPFEITTQVGTIADFKVDVPSSVRSWFGGKEGSLIDIYGGEWHYDNYTAMLDDSRGQDRGVVIRYGVNLIDFQQEKNCEEVWTGVLPYWANEEGTVVRANIINLEGSFDFRRILCLDLSQDFEEQPTTAQLIARAQTYINANKIGVPRVSLSLDWAQSTEVVELCDTVTVEFERLGISTKAKCVRTVWDALKERYTRIEIGDARTNITDTIHNLQQEEEKQKTSVSNAMLRAIANATALITGNEGGYFIVHDSNGDGFPDETLWMDTNDIETATRVWRFNQAGLGFSSSGYDGPYGLAITMNGEIVADFVTTGTLSAVDIDGVNITGSNITGGTVTGATLSNGGTFEVDPDGVVTLTVENITKGLTLRNVPGTTDTRLTASRFVRTENNQTILDMTGGSIIGTGQCSFAMTYSSTLSVAPNVVVVSGGTLYRSTSSSRRYKHDINADLGDLDPEPLYDVSVVRFKYNDDYLSEGDQNYGKDVIGFIAEDVAEKYPVAVNYDDEGKPEMWQSNYLIPAMLKLIQNQKKEIDELRARLDRLEARFSDDGR